MKSYLYFISLICIFLSGNLFAQKKTTNYQVSLISEKTEKPFNTIISLDFIKDSLELYLFSKFNYPPFDIQTITDSSITLTKENHQIEIISSKFDTLGQVFSYSDEGRYLTKINGQRFWGTDGDFPREKISKIRIHKDDSLTTLPPSIFQDLFEPNFHFFDNGNGQYCFTHTYITDNEELIITMMNSDGAVGYRVLFLFNNKFNLIARTVGYGF
jgi:hypothetical protein